MKSVINQLKTKKIGETLSFNHGGYDVTVKVAESQYKDCCQTCYFKYNYAFQDCSHACMRDNEDVCFEEVFE